MAEVIRTLCNGAYLFLETVATFLDILTRPVGDIIHDFFSYFIELGASSQIVDRFESLVISIFDFLLSLAVPLPLPPSNISFIALLIYFFIFVIIEVSVVLFLFNLVKSVWELFPGN